MEESRLEMDLPNKMAGLDIMELDSVVSGTTRNAPHAQRPEIPTVSRVLRKRKPLLTENNKSTIQNADVNLDIMELDNLTSTSTEPLSSDHTKVKTENRVLRKRKPLSPETDKSTNRRVSMRPRKHMLVDDASPKQIEALYLNKKVKKATSQTLETIFEEPKTENEPSNLMGGRKVKRLLSFQLGNQYTKEKIKKRRAKIKKLFGNKAFTNRKKIPMQMFLKTIQCLELDEGLQGSGDASSSM